MGELKEECKALGVSDKGKKAELIVRIKEAKASVEESAEEAVVEEAAVEEATVEEPAAEEAAPEEPAAEEPATEEPAAEEPEAEAMEVEEEDGPLEEWTVKELKDECKALGVSDKGKKTELIVRIKEAK